MNIRLNNTVLALLLPLFALCQKTYVVDSTIQGYRIIIPGKQYERNARHQFFWGRHYRKEWATAVKVPVIDLDTIKGGLTPVEQGGGRQTKTLRLQDGKGKQYVLRSIDKNYKGALPPDLAGTFIEDLANDQVSTAHPFGAIIVPGLIESAGVYHTNPIIVFVPYSPRLGEFNEVFANTLCLFEERPDDDQSDAPYFGFSKNVVGTPKMMEKTREENDHQVDQVAFVRARLFDIFLGDWGRHEDQWRWAQFDSSGYKIYKPIPRDRDQAFTKFDGVLLNIVSSIANLDHLQSFSHTIDDIETYNFPARNLDRRFTNEIPRKTWLEIATELQSLMTDQLIETNVRRLPPEMFVISGAEMISKLKKRRDDLLKYAEDYYSFISKEVEVVGSEQAEVFYLRRLNENETRIEVYDLNKEGEQKKEPFYVRTFSGTETNEVRVYGLKGEDKYIIEGEENKIMLRIIGGIDKDSVINSSGERGKIIYYDNPGNSISGKIKTKLSVDTLINSYEYGAFRYSSGGIIARPSYSNRRGFYFSLGYKYEQQQWRKRPFGWKQLLKGYYSFSNNSFGVDYEGVFTELVGKWNLLLNGGYDQKLDNYFLGIGNETKLDGEKLFYKMFSTEANFTADLNRKLGKGHELGIRGIYDMAQVKNDDTKFFHLSSVANDPTIYNRKHFGGGEVYYTYQSFNHEVVPTKGFRFTTTASHIENLSQNNRSFNRYTGFVGFYLPLTKAFSLASRNGVATIKGRPEFYQLNTIGGGQTLRGYFRQRFYGKSSAFNNNDLRWIFNVRSKIFNGKMGLIAFADNARVWQPGEDSDKWHFGYGGGLLIAPFNRMAVTVYYGNSNELGKFHFRLGRFF